MRRLLLLLAVVLVMTAMLLATALPAFAKGGVADKCGPPGLGHSIFAKFPGSSTKEAFGGPPGEAIADICAPGKGQSKP
jgi:hypothetical protein